MSDNQYRAFTVTLITDEEDNKGHEIVDYFPLTRVFVETFFYTLAILCTIWAVLNLIMLSSNIFTWVESFSDLGSMIINAALQTYNADPVHNIGSVQAVCYVGGPGSCTSANGVPNFYMPINPRIVS
jgi:hypothetical protein